MNLLKLEMIIWHENRGHEYGLFVFSYSDNFYFVRIEYFVENNIFDFAAKLLLKLDEY